MQVEYIIMNKDYPLYEIMCKIIRAKAEKGKREVLAKKKWINFFSS